LALVVLQFALAQVALAAGGVSGSASLVVRFVEPRGGHGWLVEAKVGDLVCRGVVGVNPGYLQARAVSSGLVVLPLYYVLSVICGSDVALVGAVDGLSGLPRVRVVFEAPEGFVARSGLDWRGFGAPGGPYVVPGWLLKRFYLYDGVVVVDLSRYRVVDFGEAGLSLVVYRGFSGAAVSLLAGAVEAASAGARDVFGVSPRSPVVAVVASPGEFALLAPATAYSLGGVFVVVDGLAGRDPGWYVHVFAHEAVHGWVNDGLVYGDFSFGEAVVEFVALRSLFLHNRSLYALAEPYSGEGVDSGEPYAVWMRAHAALWGLSRGLCGGDPYVVALRSIFTESINASTPRVYSVIDVLRLVEEQCGVEPLRAWGAVLPRVEELNLTRVLEEPGHLLGLAGLTEDSASCCSDASPGATASPLHTPGTGRGEGEPADPAAGGVPAPAGNVATLVDAAAGSSYLGGLGAAVLAALLVAGAAALALRRGLTRG